MIPVSEMSITRGNVQGLGQHALPRVRRLGVGLREVGMDLDLVHHGYDVGSLQQVGQDLGREVADADHPEALVVQQSPSAL